MRSPGLPLAAALAILAGCGGGLDDPRAAEIVSVLARADAPMIRARPALVAGKYALMAREPYAFYRGTLAVYHHDWDTGASGLSASSFALETPGRRGELAEGARRPAGARAERRSRRRRDAGAQGADRLRPRQGLPAGRLLGQ